MGKRCGALLGAAVALCALSGCGQSPGADGYAFGQKEYDQRRIMVALVEHPSLADLRAAANERGAVVEGGRELMAWSVLQTDRSGCEVHIVDPAVSWHPEWLGHEVAHCFFGRWHG